MAKMAGNVEISRFHSLFWSLPFFDGHNSHRDYVHVGLLYRCIYIGKKSIRISNNHNRY